MTAVDDPIFSLKVPPEDIISELETALKPGPPGRAVVPNVVNLMVEEASLLVSRLGLKVDTVVLTPNPAPVEGKVVRQDPQPGQKLRRGRSVTLYLEFPQKHARPEG
jgi:beta-lactam-binding protein with PASTA domain